MPSLGFLKTEVTGKKLFISFLCYFGSCLFFFVFRIFWPSSLTSCAQCIAVVVARGK